MEGSDSDRKKTLSDPTQWDFDIKKGYQTEFGFDQNVNLAFQSSAWSSPWRKSKQITPEVNASNTIWCLSSGNQIEKKNCQPSKQK
jgi:hypothetical protein